MNYDLTGITNRNEYFASHYFASSFYTGEDVQNALHGLEEAKKAGRLTKTPWRSLSDAAQRYYTAHEQFGRSRSRKDKGGLISDMAEDYLSALGFYQDGSTASPVEIPMEGDKTAPVWFQVTRESGAPWLWVILSAPAEEGEDFLSAHPFAADKLDTPDEAISPLTNEDLANAAFFGSGAEHPRFLLFIGMNDIALLDRSTWGEKRYFSFALDTIFGRREPTTLKAMTVLLHHDFLCPKDGKPLLDTLSAESYKNANAVSGDLKYALRESVERLGNEVLYYYRHHPEAGVNPDTIDAADLSIQCIRYMYRLLFLFFIEARPELGYAPAKSDVYTKGYSLEALRSLAETTKVEEMPEDGTFVSDSLSTLFDLIYDGYPADDKKMKRLDQEKSTHDAFVIHPLKAHIFDRARTPLLRDAKLRDSVMLTIINLMSLSRPAGKKERRGRISYASLGINQIGAVYEALLSYRGFIAKEKLYEVKKAGDTVNELDVGYFVPEREVEHYSEDERVRYTSGPMKGKLRTYEKGTFIYRLAGREREKSASYYTPESLTRCLVKYALKELLTGKSADDILHLKVCEPAMGSAAFLNEAINQLAEAYLTKKQAELHDTIPAADRSRELQKVKMYIADENVYGIDLNPTAVELAEVSLWLNTIYRGGYVPWFRTQLVNGNSLIGASRSVYPVTDILGKPKMTKAEKEKLWYNHAPLRLSPKEQRDRRGEVYHFLLGDPGMASYTDKVVKGLEKENIDLIKKWNKEFTAPYTKEETAELLELSAKVDSLFASQVRLRHMIDEKTQDKLTVYPEKDASVEMRTTIREKDAFYQTHYLSDHQQNAGPYARLKFAMDYWCALWFWPIERAEDLPTRSQFINEMYLILDGTVDTKGTQFGRGDMETMSLFGDEKEKLHETSLFAAGAGESEEDRAYRELVPKGKTVDLDQLCQLFPRLQLVKEIREKNHFLHWELEFADVFAERGGFDLILGNPPWIKIQWNEQAVLADDHPLLAVRKVTAPEVAKERSEALADHLTYESYLAEYEAATGQQNFLNADVNGMMLKGQKANLYKCFLPQAWKYVNKKGCSAFIHPDGVYDDPKGGALRKTLFPRLRKHFMFANERKLFSEVDHHTTFSLNVYGGPLRTGVKFDSISDLYDPATIDECYSSTSRAKVPGLKDENGDWDIRGHRHRILRITEKELSVFAGLFDDSSDWETARLPAIHARELMEALDKIYDAPRKLRDIWDNVTATVMWDETKCQRLGIIKRDVHFPDIPEEGIISGPHIGVANPLFKCSRRICRLNSDYDNVDLTSVPDDYKQRCNYSRACTPSEYNSQMVKTGWGTNFNDDYMICSRHMLNTSGERTLIATIIPPKFAFINAIYGLAFKDYPLSPLVGGMASVPYDFYLKITGKDNGGSDTLGALPLFQDAWLAREISTRALMLNCLTTYYADLWAREMKGSATGWAKEDPRLDPARFSTIGSEWKRENTLRTDYERREALVELDVLTAMSLHMTLDELKTIYRIQFPVLQSYEKGTWYDAAGRIAFTNNRSLTNVGFPSSMRKEWEGTIKDANPGATFSRTISDDTMPGGPVTRTITYTAPFDRCDREKDYETVWRFFEEKYGK